MVSPTLHCSYSGSSSRLQSPGIVSTVGQERISQAVSVRPPFNSGKAIETPTPVDSRIRRFTRESTFWDISARYTFSLTSAWRSYGVSPPQQSPNYSSTVKIRNSRYAGARIMANSRQGSFVLANRSAIILAPPYRLFRIFTVSYSSTRYKYEYSRSNGVD